MMPDVKFASRWTVAGTFVSALLISVARGGSLPSTRPNWYPGDDGKASLVEATYMGSVPLADPYLRVEFRVEKVFAGSIAVVGDKLCVAIDKTGDNFRSELDLPIPRPGQHGIWMIANDHGGLHRLILSSMPWFGVLDDNSGYANAKALASKVNEYCQLPPERESDFLWTLAESQNDAIVVWSIQMLASQFPADFCMKAPRIIDAGRAAIREQVSIDVEMIRLKPSAWISCTTRGHLLPCWATSKSSEDELNFMASHLYTEAQQHFPGDDMLVATCASIALNNEMPLTARKIVIAALRVMSDQYHMEAAADGLRKVLSTSHHPK